MSGQQAAASNVTDIIEALLPKVNAGFNWDVVQDRFDPDPTGKSLTMHFLAEDGETLAEAITLGVHDKNADDSTSDIDPELIITTEDDDRFEKVGDIVTFQDYGLRVLDPDDPMTPQKARYQYNGVNIESIEGESRERVWLIGSTILEIMLDSIINADGGDA